MALKDKPWLAGLIAGICGILSFALPTVFGSLEGVLYGVWMWGLYSGSMGGVTVTLFLPDEIGLIVSIPTLISSIIICITYIIARPFKRDKKLGIIWAILGAIMFSLLIFYFTQRWTIFILPGVFPFHLGFYLNTLAGIWALVSGILMIRTPKYLKRVNEIETSETELEYEQEIIEQEIIDKVYKFFKENVGKAFTIKALMNRMLEMEIKEISQVELEQVLKKLITSNKITFEQKDGINFYLL
ncbi:MAG: hypothetical protein WBH31_18250 [Promethearchaeia archaeon]